MQGTNNLLLRIMLDMCKGIGPDASTEPKETMKHQGYDCGSWLKHVENMLKATQLTHALDTVSTTINSCRMLLVNLALIRPS